MATYKRLTPTEWELAEKRVFLGEPIRVVAADFEISEGALRKRIKKDHDPKVAEVANLVVKGHEAMQALPPRLQIKAKSLADALINISTSLATSAELSAKTSMRLANIANLHASKIDDEMPDPDVLRMVHGLTETANKAAYQPLELIKANKEMMSNAGEEEAPTIDPTKLSSETRKQLLEARDAANRS